MGKKSTLAVDNVFCTARYEAAKENIAFQSREATAPILGIDRTRLANIELGKLTPYPEEVLTMSKHYGTPEICNAYCSRYCPLGKSTVKELTLDDLDRLMLKVLGSLKGIEQLRTRLITIAEDGEITGSEQTDFEGVLQELQDVSQNAQTLQLWAKKYIDDFNSK
ncbi:MAG: XRE family transcriptional regulator [Oscillospiraceae bacterium]